jgi:hypothetical protein
VDRLNQKVNLLDQQTPSGPFDQRLRSLYADAKIDHRTFVEMLDSYHEEIGDATAR